VLFGQSGVNPAPLRTVKLSPALLIRLFRKTCTIRRSVGLVSACQRTYPARRLSAWATRGSASHTEMSKTFRTIPSYSVYDKIDRVLRGSETGTQLESRTSCVPVSTRQPPATQGTLSQPGRSRQSRSENKTALSELARLDTATGAERKCGRSGWTGTRGMEAQAAPVGNSTWSGVPWPVKLVVSVPQTSCKGSCRFSFRVRPASGCSLFEFCNGPERISLGSGPSCFIPRLPLLRTFPPECMPTLGG
jgi:hypothetical protein